MAANDKTQRSGGIEVGFPGGGPGKAVAPGSNQIDKGKTGVPSMPALPTGNTKPPTAAGKYKGIPDGD